MKKVSVIPFFLIVGLNPAFAENMDPSKTTWVIDFFRAGIMTVEADYTFEFDSDKDRSEQYFRELNYHITYERSSNQYQFEFLYEYREDWNVLTENGKSGLPVQQPYFIGSKIQPWTDTKGLGVYTEKYERTIPNWLIFQNLDTLLLMQMQVGNPSPTLTGIFMTDEIKALKRIQKNEEEFQNEQDFIRFFEFDHAGNLLGFSQAYLDEFSEKSLTDKSISNATISFRNSQEDLLTAVPLFHTSEVQLLEGFVLKYENKKMRCFSIEVNRMFHKFAPGLFEDPDVLIINFIEVLQAANKKDFTRFQTISER